MSFITLRQSNFGATTFSGLIDLSVSSSVTASTTQTQGQSALTATVNNVSTVANASDVVTLPSAVAGRLVIIMNNGAQTLQVFPASGDSIDEATVDNSKTQAAGSNFIYVAQNTTNWNRINASL